MLIKSRRKGIGKVNRDNWDKITTKQQDGLEPHGEKRERSLQGMKNKASRELAA